MKFFDSSATTVNSAVVFPFRGSLSMQSPSEESAGQMGKKEKGSGVRIHEELRVSGHAAE